MEPAQAIQEDSPSARDERPTTHLELPPGPLAELLAAAPPEPTKSPLGLPPWPAWSDRSAQGWGAWEPWERWVRQLQPEAALSPEERSKHCISLALLAKLQDRDLAGWEHLVSSGDGAWVARALPSFLPGRPASELYGAAQQPGFDGCFRPALPPAANPLDPQLRSLNGKSYEHRTVRLGESVFAMRLQLEGDGIQVDLTHRSGPPVSFSVLPPEPDGVRIALLYADWIKVGTQRQPVPVTLAPGDPTFTIWGRFLNLENAAPMPRTGRVPSTTPHSPEQLVQLVVPAGRMDEPFLGHLARALSSLVGARVQLVSRVERGGADFLEPLVIHLGEGEESEKRLLELLDRVEGSVLARWNQPEQRPK